MSPQAGVVFQRLLKSDIDFPSPACLKQTLSNVSISINKAIILNDSSLRYSMPLRHDTFTRRMSIKEEKAEKLISRNQKREKKVELTAKFNPAFKVNMKPCSQDILFL